MRDNYRYFPSQYTRLGSWICALNECKMFTRNAIKPGRKDQQKKDIFLSRRGVLYVINKCRKPTHNLINLTKHIGIELQEQMVVQRARRLGSNHAGL